ncbi:MAG: putative aminohydrolase SsnA [Spirochaetes bacterium]|jgi:putative selenium metabolism protein SsnA|nr:putative aminohydrolase SsnA [Spirochaetota bacterium]
MILFRNATLVEFDPPRVREGQDVAVEGDRIAAVGPDLAGNGGAGAGAPVTGAPGRVIDAGGKLLLPGLVCSHTHLYSAFARGIMAEIGPMPDFVSVLKQLWWRVDQAVDEDILYYSALTAALDAIRTGTTAIIDHHASPNMIEGSLATIKRAFEEAGIRGATCYEVTDRHGTEGMRAGVAENEAFAGLLDTEAADGRASGLVASHIGGHAPCTLPDDGLELIADACSRTGRGFHVHVAEDRWDVSHSHYHYGTDIIPRLDAYGLLDERTLLIHGVHLSPAEVDLVNERDAFLIHNVRSNMNNGVGYNRNLPRLRNLALGTDGIGADMFTETRTAFFKHRDEAGPWGPDGFLAALAAGNRVLGRSFARPFGRLEPGHTADLVLADYPSPTPLRGENLAGHLAFAMGPDIVETVMVGGRLVMENRRFSRDLAPVYAEARGQARRLWERVNAIQA